jgi:mannosyltransferase
MGPSIVFQGPPGLVRHGLTIITRNKGLGLLIAIGLALRVFHIGTASLWNDELFTRFYPDLGIDYMWTDGFSEETTPPTYYTFLLGWIKLFGTSPSALRWPSVIFSTMTIPLTYALGRELDGRFCGLVAAFLFAIAPMEIYYAQEARAYAMMGVPAGLALLGAAWLLRDPKSLRGLVCYVFGVVGSVYVHNVGAFLAASMAVAVALDFLTDPRQPRTAMLLRWVVANGLAALLCVPEMMAMLSEVKTDQLEWMAPMAFWDVRNAIATFVAGPATTPLRMATLLTVVLGAAVFIALLFSRLNRRTITMVIAIPVLDLALMIGAGTLTTFLLPRVLVWLWIPLAVLLAVLIHRGRARLLLGAVTASVLTVGLGYQLTMDATAKEPWDVFFPKLVPFMAHADLVVTGPWTQPMALANQGVDMTKVRHWDEHFPRTIESGAIRTLLGIDEISRADLVNAIRGGKRVLLIQRSIEYQYRPLLTGIPEPSEVTQQCWAEAYCLKAYYWE